MTQLSRKQQAQVEALSSVIKYCKLVQMSIKEFQNFVHFEENSELYFLKDFTESAANAPMYFKLKDDIKLLWNSEVSIIQGFSIFFRLN